MFMRYTLKPQFLCPSSRLDMHKPKYTKNVYYITSKHVRKPKKYTVEKLGSLNIKDSVYPKQWDGKCLDGTPVGTNLGGTAYKFTILNEISEGTDNNQRIGRCIHMLRLQLWVRVTGLTSGLGTTYSNDMARIVVLYDEQPAGGPPLASEVFTSGNSLAPFNRDNCARFEIIKDKLFAISNSTGGPQSYSAIWDIPLDHDVRFNATSGTLGSDISTGSLVIGLGPANNGTVLAIQGLIQYSYRLEYTDH